MAITREKKEQLVKEYRERIEHSSAIVFTNYRGTNVQQAKALRARLQDSGATYMVVKNTLLGVALEQSGRVRPDALLDGPNGVAFLGEDIGRGVTALMDWIKEAKVLEIRGALLEASVLDAAGAEALANLPTKEQMLATVLGAINAPAGSLARMLNAPGASLVRAINARAEKMQESEAA